MINNVQCDHGPITVGIYLDRELGGRPRIRLEEKGCRGDATPTFTELADRTILGILPSIFWVIEFIASHMRQGQNDPSL